MHKRNGVITLRRLSLTLAALTALTVAPFMGCDDDPSLDGIDRAPPMLKIFPDPVVLTHPYDAISFQAMGAVGTVRWEVANPRAGSVRTLDVRTDYAIYIMTPGQPFPNTVFAIDALGRTDSVAIPYAGGVDEATTLRIVPDTVQLLRPSRGPATRFTVSGGTPPYSSFFVSQPALGTVDESGMYSVASATLEGTNIVSIVDSRSEIATATVEHLFEIKPLEIIPEALTMDAFGDTIYLIGEGGSRPYTWELIYPTLGAFVVRNSTTIAYTSSGAGEQIIVLRDRDGRSTQVTITQTDDAVGDLTIAPTDVSLPTNGETATFYALGGRAPYTWALTYASRGTIVQSSGTTMLYRRNTEGDQIIILRDGNGDIAQVSVQQPGVGTPVIEPAFVTLAPNETTYAFSVTGGQAPYVWQVLTGTGTVNPNTGTQVVYTRGVLDPPNNYIIRVTDANGRSGLATITQQ